MELIGRYRERAGFASTALYGQTNKGSSKKDKCIHLSQMGERGSVAEKRVNFLCICFC